MKEIKVVLADDHLIVRAGLKALLNAEKDISVVGEAGDGLETVRLVERLKPDVLILDLVMPGLHGLEVTRQLALRVPKTRIVILSVTTDESRVVDALRNGATGYVTKESAAGDLVRAIHEAVAGRRYLSPPLSATAIDTYLHKAKGAPRDRYESLTPRERETLHLVAEGHTNAEMGHRLFISPRTVEIHRANMMRKMNFRSIADVARYALERGLVKRTGHSPPRS